MRSTGLRAMIAPLLELSAAPLPPRCIPALANPPSPKLPSPPASAPLPALLREMPLPPEATEAEREEAEEAEEAEVAFASADVLNAREALVTRSCAIMRIARLMPRKARAR